MCTGIRTAHRRLGRGLALSDRGQPDHAGLQERTRHNSSQVPVALDFASADRNTVNSMVNADIACALIVMTASLQGNICSGKEETKPAEGNDVSALPPAEEDSVPSTGEKIMSPGGLLAQCSDNHAMPLLC